MKVLILEDEQPASQKLIRLLGEVEPPLEVSAVLRSVEDATNWLLNHEAPGLIFMDIQLEDGLCFEVFENVRVESPVIFTTAYNDYTLKAFKVNSVDYLLKPIDRNELGKALEKYRRVHHPETVSRKLEHLMQELKPEKKERFLIKIGEHYRPVQTRSVRYFYIRERSTFLHDDKGRDYPLDYSLDRIEELVDAKNFFRINRNFIINVSAIKDIVAYSSSRLKIDLAGWDEEDVIVSRERTGAFKKWMDR